MTSYVTKKGDMWDQIALDTLGSELYANQLIDANFAYSKLMVFDAGVELIIPSINTAKSDVDLPPWRS